MIQWPLIVITFALVWWMLLRICTRKWVRVVVTTAAVFLALPMSLLTAQWSYEAFMRVRAARIRSQIERYRSAHGEYPIALSQLGVVDTRTGVHYQRDFESPLVYHLWFGTGIGTVAEYDSKTRTWHGPQ